MKFYCLGLLLLCLLTGCVSPKANYHPVVNEISRPPLDTVTEACVGEEMLKQGKFTEEDVIYLSEDVKVGLVYTLRRGYYKKIGIDGTSGFYMPLGSGDSGRVDASVFADPWKCIQVTDENKVGVITVFDLRASAGVQDFRRESKLVSTSDSFQQTLIYSGRIGNKINIGYREYFSNAARPAFNNDVEYDLSESKIIGYKGARIEVLESTNELIRYKVIQNFNNAVR